MGRHFVAIIMVYFLIRDLWEGNRSGCFVQYVLFFLVLGLQTTTTRLHPQGKGGPLGTIVQEGSRNVHTWPTHVRTR